MIREYPNWYEVHRDRGVANFFLGRFEDAVADLTRAIELNPYDGLAYDNRAVTYERLGRYEENLADLERASELDPDVRGNLAHAKIRMGRVREALEDFEKLLELNPFSAPGHAGRAEALGYLGDCDGAMEAFERTLSLNPNANTLANLVVLHTDNLFYFCPDRYDAAVALDLASRALEAGPGDPVGAGVYGMALYRNGRYREALENIRKGLAPSTQKTTFYSAMTLWQLGRRAEARAHFEKSAAFMNEHKQAHPGQIRMRKEAAALLGIEP